MLLICIQITGAFSIRMCQIVDCVKKFEKNELEI